ncbi:MAG: hypothetical protein E7652_07380 [Ruminococcaceae bacterium]|nr:hypothetical protein [Oscillospiraceae bacterium]
MDDLLFARIDDLIKRAENGMFAYGDFLNEGDAAKALRYISRYKGELEYRLWGGFEGSVRNRLFVYPDYYDFEYSCDCIRAVEIRGSGYAELKHSSFLGALTSLGIDRAKMGDIVVRDNSGILFADEKIADFLLSSPPPLTRVGRDTVKLIGFTPDENFSVAHEFREILDTVSSPRLDAVVSSLVCVSREKAKGIVISGLVTVDHIEEIRPDFQIEAGNTVTIRGYGKFIIDSISEKTKKDRYRLKAKKYV